MVVVVEVSSPPPKLLTQAQPVSYRGTPFEGISLEPPSSPTGAYTPVASVYSPRSSVDSESPSVRLLPEPSAIGCALVPDVPRLGWSHCWGEAVWHGDER